MKKNILLLLFLGIMNLIYAQTIPFSIQKSDVFKDETVKSSIVIADKYNENDLLIVRSYNNNGLSLNEGFIIELYNSNLKRIKEFNFDSKHPNSEKYNIVIGAFTFQNNIIIVETFFDLNRKAYICEANIISTDFKISKKELFSFSKEDIKDFGTFSLQDKFYSKTNSIWTNDNSGNISSELETGLTDKTDNFTNSDITLVVNKTKSAFAIAVDFKGQKTEDLKLYVFDNKLNKKFETVFTKDAKDKKYIFESIQISDDGKNLFVVAKSYPNGLNNKKKGGNYVFELTKISAISQKTQEINPNDHFIGSLSTFLQNDTLICLGFYSDSGDFKYTGLSYFSLNSETLAVTNAKYNPFSQQFLKDKYGEKKPKALNNIAFRNVFFNPDGTLVLNAEETYISVSQSAGMNGMSGGGQTYYNFNDIISLKLNSEGNLTWARNINKDQSTAIDENAFFISYTSTILNDKTYFFINTKDKIKKLENDRIEFGQTSKNKSNLNLIQLDSNGNFDYHEILDDQQNEVPFMVSKGIIIDNSVYFLGRRGNNKQLLKVTL